MKIETFPFSKDGCREAGKRNRGVDWPVVYLIHNDKELYVGETSSFQNRFQQHLQNKERKELTTISFVDDEEFNKSAVLDIEQGLIRLCSADKKYVLQNKNAGQSGMHDYFQRDKYESKIPEIWKEMSKKGLTRQSYNDVINLDLYKYSPYIALTNEQNDVCYNILNDILETLQNGSSRTSLIHGGAGTGKTIVAIRVVHTLANISSMNIDDMGEETSDKWKLLIRKWKNYVKKHKMPKIGFVVPMQSLNATLSDVFKDAGGDEMKNLIISPYKVADEKYDIIIVDESHRLKRRKALAHDYRLFDECCDKLGLDSKTSNQLEWIVKQSRHRVLFYDQAQSIKPCDISPDVFANIVKKTICREEKLTSQMRCLGGENFVKYINDVFDMKLVEKMSFGKKFQVKVFDDATAMIQQIKEKNRQLKLCRVVAGFSWKWATKGKSLKKIMDDRLYDIEIDGCRYIWNTTDKNWIMSENAINEIGCVHTTQGYDLNFVGLIFGKEIEWDEKRNVLVIDLKKFYDAKVKEKSTLEEVKSFIINAYKVMMVRGIKGCYLYACNPGMKKFLKRWFG